MVQLKKNHMSKDCEDRSLRTELVGTYVKGDQRML